MAYKGDTWKPPYPSSRKPGIIFKPQGKTGLFSIPVGSVNNIHSGAPEAWTRFEKDHKIFRSTVKLNVILERLKDLTLPSKYLFLSQIFKHPTIPQEVKNQLILKLFGGHISDSYDEEIEIISYYASPDEETKEWNTKFIEAIFCNINLIQIKEDWLALACQRFIPEHAELAIRSLLANKEMTEEEKTKFFSYMVFYGTEKNVSCFVENIPNDSNGIAYILDSYYYFYTDTHFHDKLEHILMKKIRLLYPEWEVFPDSWCLEMIKGMAKIQQQKTEVKKHG